MMTIAQKIGQKFHDNGQIFVNEERESISTLCEMEFSRKFIGHNEIVRYEFVDGSVLTLAWDRWDYGFVGCFCWQGLGCQCGNVR